jgi:hypothetical protein
MKKATGKPRGGNDRIHGCISIEKWILDKTHSEMLGLHIPTSRDSGSGKETILYGRSQSKEGWSMSHLLQHKTRMTGILMLLLRLVICLLSLVLLAVPLPLPLLTRCRIQVTTKR